MALENLKYPAQRVCEDLRRQVGENLTRYLSGDFRDLAMTDDWSIPLELKVDLLPLGQLHAAADDDTKSTLVVWQCLSGVTPSIASEGRIWTRLTHVEGLLYSRARWIGSRIDDVAIKAIEDHFFADTRTACRDDNAIGRLWWTAYVAHCAMPNDHAKAVAAIWKTADIRSNVIERPWITARPALAGAIVRAIINNPAATASESSFRDFMKALNARGGGLLFEAMGQPEMDSFVASCVSKP